MDRFDQVIQDAVRAVITARKGSKQKAAQTVFANAIESGRSAAEIKRLAHDACERTVAIWERSLGGLGHLHFVLAVIVVDKAAQRL